MRIADRPYLTLFAIGLAVHLSALGFVQVRSGGIAVYAFRSPDAREYYDIARNLATQGVYAQGESLPLQPDTWRTPGYPVFLAALMVFVGDSPETLVVVQHILALVNVVIFFAVVREWLGARRALLAALLFLFEPYHVLYAGWLLSTTWQVTLLLAAWGAWQAVVRTRAQGWWIILGLLIGALILVWPGHVVTGGCLFVVAWWARWRVNRRARFSSNPQRISVSSPILLLVAAALVVAPWLERNRRISGHIALSDQSGVVLAYFKAAEVLLWRQGGSESRYLELSTDAAHAAFPHATWDAIDRELKLCLADLDESARGEIHWSRLAQGNRTSIDSFRISHELADIGLRNILASPLSAVACYTVRMVDQLTFPVSLGIAPPTGVNPNRLKSIALGTPFVLLALLVLLRLWRGKFEGLDLFFPFITTLAMLLVAAPQIDPRFRVPMIPLLLFVALLPRENDKYRSAEQRAET